MSAPVSHQPSTPAWEELHYRVDQLAEAWQVSTNTIRRLFEDEPGIVVLAGDRKRGVRQYRTVRIPQSVAERVYARLRQPA